MKAIHLIAYGDPEAGLRCVETPEPDKPGPNEAIIELEYAPINVSDLLLASGMYAAKPSLPTVIGNEGVGTVSAVGQGVTSVKIGDRVLVPHGVFAWAQKVLAPASSLFIVPQDIDPKQASMLSINPPTAALLLRDFVNLQPGDWLVQNSANSGVGRAVIAFAREAGVKTINIVRRQELVSELRSLGADVVVVDSPNVVEEVSALTKGANIRLGLDGVSGAATGVLADILSWGGTIGSYASPTKEPVAVHQLTLVAKHLSVHGFYMYYPEHLGKLNALFAESASLVQQGKLLAPIAATYPIGSITEAVRHANAGGKVLLDFKA